MISVPLAITDGLPPSRKAAELSVLQPAEQRFTPVADVVAKPDVRKGLEASVFTNPRLRDAKKLGRFGSREKPVGWYARGSLWIEHGPTVRAKRPKVSSGAFRGLNCDPEPGSAAATAEQTNAAGGCQTATGPRSVDT
jgi:hypothetical protein